MAIAFAICIFQTYQLMGMHFTHTDDTGVADTLLFRATAENYLSCKNLAYKFSHFPFGFDRALGRINEYLCTPVLWWERLSVIPSQWTYAPFQFWFTQAILDPRFQYEYETIKALGRLPSFISYLVGLISFYFLLKRFLFSSKSNLNIPALLTLVLALSLELRIMASQMESYAIGVVSNCLALFALFSLCRRDLNIGYKLLTLYGVALGLSVAMQYQALILVASGIFSLFICEICQRKKKESVLKIFYVTLICALTVFVSAGNIFRLSNRGVMWNAGPSGQFLVQGETLFERSPSFVEVVLTNIAYNTYSIVSGIELGDFSANLLGLLFLTGAMLGVFNLARNSKFSINSYFLILSIFYLASYFGLIFFGKLAFSPTRHTLYMLPVLLIYFGYGIDFLNKKYPQKIVFIGVSSLVFLYCAVSLVSFDEFSSKRKDILSNQLFEELIQKNDPDFFLAGGFDRDFIFMPSMQDQTIYDYLDKNADMVCFKYRSLLIPKSRKLRFIWYSKRYRAPELDPQFQTFLSNLINNCTQGISVDKQKIAIRRLGNPIDIESPVEIDLSQKTKNGSNNYFFQLFEIETEFDSLLYPASLSEGINFSFPGYPNFLKYVAGISQRENWGRWSDGFFGGPVVVLGFKQSLPKKFTLELQAISYADNGEGNTVIRVGGQERRVKIGQDPHFIYRFQFENIQASTSQIEIIPPHPRYPRELDPSNSDPRKLGIGLISLKIN